MGKLETLQAKLAKLQADIQAAEEEDRQEQARKAMYDALSAAVSQSIAKVEKETGISLQEKGLGVWFCYGHENPCVSILQAGDDGLPKQFRRTPSKNGAGNGNGNGQHNGNGNGYDYFLKDGRGPFSGTHEALDALGIPKDQRGQYYHRWDRLPKELQAEIIRKPKAEEQAEGEDKGKAGKAA